MIVSVVWALVTFFGAQQISGTLYYTEGNCQKALQLAINAESCHPDPGKTCVSGPNPDRKCIQMSIGSEQWINATSVSPQPGDHK